LPAFEYALSGTPCARVAGQNLCVFPQDVQAQFPADHMLVEMGIQGYAGCPLFDHAGQPLGVCVVLSKRPLKEVQLARTLLKLVAGRLEAELERKRVEEEKARLQGQLIQAHKMESVGRLAGGVAHDFNNMLQVILGNVALALTQAQPGSPLRDDLLEIEKSARRSAELTRQLLAFARKQAVNPRVLDLNDTIAGMLKMLQRLMGEDITLRWLPGAGLWPVKMDPAQVDQILANLAANARDAIPGAGRVTIETGNVALDAAAVQGQPDCAPGDYVQLAFSDNGRGMTREVLEHLFEPFFTTKDVGKGTGLGLATVFGIVKQNHGFVSVYSEPDQGTSLKVLLPRTEGAAAQLPEADSTKLQRGAESVLLVEDEEQILNLSRRFLQQQGYTVLATRSAVEALRLVREHAGQIHLLITDVVMPNMNGKELRDQLRPLQPELKCLFMSGYTANVIAQHGVLDEGVLFLEKPFTNRALALKVREALEFALPKGA
jgi:signal transduction histidine kinase/ActR/RegA family two-component response regulator